MTPDLSTERAILDLLSDEDDEYHTGEALTTLVNVVAGICLQARRPDDLAVEFALKLHRAMIEADKAGQPRWLS